MTEATTARGLPGSVTYLALAGLFFTSRPVYSLHGILPTVALVVLMALQAVGCYWLIAMLYLRSDPRVWRPKSAWYRANLEFAPPEERDLAAPAIRAVLAPRLRQELSIMAAVGAAMGTVPDDMAGAAMAAAAGGLTMWWIGALLDLRTTEKKPG